MSQGIQRVDGETTWDIPHGDESALILFLHCSIKEELSKSWYQELFETCIAEVVSDYLSKSGEHFCHVEVLRYQRSIAGK